MSYSSALGNSLSRAAAGLPTAVPETTDSGTVPTSAQVRVLLPGPGAEDRQVIISWPCAWCLKRRPESIAAGLRVLLTDME
jgi:hypothetical protein